MSTRILARSAVAAAVLVSGAAHAVEIYFTAEIYGHSLQGGSHEFLASLLPIGATVEGRLNYDINAPIIWMTTTGLGAEYQYKGGEFSIDIGSFSARAPIHSTGVINGAYMGWDQFVIWTNQPDHGLTSSPAPFPVMAMGFGLYDPSGEQFTSGDLPNDGIALADFTESYFSVMFENPLNSGGYGTPEIYTASGHITSLQFFTAAVAIPEPATLPLLFLGLVGLVAWRSVSAADKDHRQTPHHSPLMVL